MATPESVEQTLISLVGGVVEKTKSASYSPHSSHFAITATGEGSARAPLTSIGRTESLGVTGAATGPARPVRRPPLRPHERRTAARSDDPVRNESAAARI